MMSTARTFGAPTVRNILSNITTTAMASAAVNSLQKNIDSASINLRVIRVVGTDSRIFSRPFKSATTGRGVKDGKKYARAPLDTVGHMRKKSANPSL